MICTGCDTRACEGQKTPMMDAHTRRSSKSLLFPTRMVAMRLP